MELPGTILYQISRILIYLLVTAHPGMAQMDQGHNLLTYLAGVGDSGLHCVERQHQTLMPVPADQYSSREGEF